MKKRTLSLTIAALTLCLTAGFATACDEDPHEHIWDGGTVTKEATCTEKGEKTYNCEDCGEIRTEKIDALGHDWGAGVEVSAPTYTHDGEALATCSRCGETRIAVIEKVSYTADAVVKSGESIQAAVDSAQTGDIIEVEAGTYAEQLMLDKSVTIIGKGEVVIAGPADYADLVAVEKLATDSKGYIALVAVTDGASVTVENVKISADPAKASAVSQITHYNYFVGVAAIDASVTLNSVTVKGITFEDHLMGMQNGTALYAAAEGENRTVTVRYSTFESFNKAAAVIRAGISMFVFEDNTVTGMGEQGLIAQNGIQIHCAASIARNVIQQLVYAPATANGYEHGSYAMLVYTADEGAVTVSDNAVKACDNGVYVNVPGSTELTGNTYTDMYEGGVNEEVAEA